MNKIDCEIIMDLLPLYCDEAVSKKTADAVKWHLATCVDCREEYENMTKALPKADVPVTTAEKFRKFIKKHSIREKLLSVLCGIIMVCAFIFAVTEPVVTVPDKDIEVVKAYRYENEKGEKKFFILYKSPIYSFSTTRKAGIIKDTSSYQLSVNQAETSYKDTTLTVAEKKPIISGSKEEKGFDDLWVVSAEGIYGDFTELKFGNTAIWTEEENGNDPVPEYVYYYDKLYDSGSWDWTVDFELDIIGGGNEDNESKYWTIEGERIEK